MNPPTIQKYYNKIIKIKTGRSTDQTFDKHIFITFQSKDIDRESIWCGIK